MLRPESVPNIHLKIKIEHATAYLEAAKKQGFQANILFINVGHETLEFPKTWELTPSEQTPEVRTFRVKPHQMLLTLKRNTHDMRSYWKNVDQLIEQATPTSNS